MHELRSVERDGLVIRTLNHEIPARVECRTPDRVRICTLFWRPCTFGWSNRWVEVEGARTTYDSINR